LRNLGTSGTPKALKHLERDLSSSSPNYPYKVLESMLKQTAELNAERYGKYVELDSTLPHKLKSLLRKDALTGFESGVYGLEKLVNYMV
jgi:hypothetical protein